MEYKVRKKSYELEVLEVLNSRMDLTKKDRQNYYNLKKGYEGELAFDARTRQLNCDCLVINDLLLQAGTTTFQIDTLIIADLIYLYEVKNFEGNYYYDNDRIFNMANYEILNPVYQLTRTETLFRQVLQSIGVNTSSLSSSVVFINPEFTLFQAPKDKPFIFSTQLNRYLKDFNSIPSRINRNHRALADKLISMHMTRSPYTQLPEYRYDELRKGVGCKKCGSYSVSVVGRKCVCERCEFVEGVDDAVLRSVQEIKLLFPDIKITTSIVQDWCRVISSRKMIRRILDNNYKLKGKNRWAYFE